MKFSDNAKEVMTIANQQAQRFGHNHIDTEHLLLGLLKIPSGNGSKILDTFNMDASEILNEIESLATMLGKNEMDEVLGELPYTARAIKVIKSAEEYAIQLSHKYVGTEHILLGLLNDTESTASLVLINLGFNFNAVKNKIIHKSQ